jgi:hypothetical protein
VFAHREVPFLAKEKRLAPLFQIPSSLVAPRRSPPASQFANLADVIRSFVQGEFPFSLAWQFLRQPGLPLAQPRNLIRRIWSFAKDFECSIAPQRALPPFAFAQPWGLQTRISFHATWVWLALVLPIRKEFAQETALLAWELRVSVREQRLPPGSASARQGQSCLEASRKIASA